MYESPIESIKTEIQIQFEDDCIKAIQSCGFNVNKEELAKALIYDRKQYEKGYSDGYEKGYSDGYVKALEYTQNDPALQTRNSSY